MAVACQPTITPPECSHGALECVDTSEVFARVPSPEPGLEDLRLDRPTIPFSVDYGGCTAVTSTPDHHLQCLYEPNTELRLWVPYPRAEDVDLTVDGRRWPFERYEQEGEIGHGYRLRLSNAEVESVSITVPGEDPWALALRSLTKLTPEQALVRESFHERARTLEQRISDRDTTAVPEVEALVLEMVEASWISDAVRLSCAASFHLTWSVERPDLSGDLLHRTHQRLDDRFPPISQRYPWAHAALSIYRAHALRQLGMSAAAATYRDAARYAILMEEHGLQRDVLAPYSLVLAESGYFEAALLWSERAIAHAEANADPYGLARIRLVAATTRLRLCEAGQLCEDPTPLFEQVLASYRRGEPLADHREPGEAWMGLAKLALRERETAKALAALDRIDEAWLGTDDRVEARGLRLQAMAMASPPQGDPWADLRVIEGLAKRSADQGSAWRVAFLRGWLHERNGSLEAAVRAYGEAERLVDQILPRFAFGAAPLQATEVARGTERLVSVLLAKGETQRAFCAARQARARETGFALRHELLDPAGRAGLLADIARYSDAKLALEAVQSEVAEMATENAELAKREAILLREQMDEHLSKVLTKQPAYRARPSCEELAPPRPGELLLGLYSHDGGLLVFASDATGTDHLLFEGFDDVDSTLSPAWLSDLVLSRIGDRINRAERIRVHAGERAAHIPVHALPWPTSPGSRARAPLGVQMPVVYGLELPPSDPPNLEPPQGKWALAVADRLASNAPAETANVAVALADHGWLARHALTSSYSPSDIFAAIPWLDHLYYGGHAYYGDGVLDYPHRPAWVLPRHWPPYPGGAASEPSYLPIGRFSQLTVPDILLMPRVPHTVVLMGCDTGVVDDRMLHGGLSLAAAFLAGGARAVVATTAEVEGTQAALVGRGLYTSTALPAIEEDPGRWMMEALGWARERGARDSAIADYRIFVR